MSIEAYVIGFAPYDYHTETLGTAITENIPGIDGARLALKSMNYLCAGTAHTASFMYAEGTGSRNTAASLAAAGQKDIICTDAPKDPAGNAAATPDILAYQCSDGTWEFNTVASLASSTITCTNNLAKAIPAGNKVLVLGVVGDNKSQRIALPASTVTSPPELSVVHPYVGEPMVLSINNITAAGFLNSLVMAYINK